MNKFYLTALFLLVGLGSAARPAGRVSGSVCDETGAPLAGVTVYVVETKQGAITDLKGAYSVAAESGATLRFSFIGYKTQEIPVGSRTVLDRVTMQPDNDLLEEVVVVGYGTQTKANLLGAVENVDVRELENRPITQASMALQGQIAGIDVVQNSGQPGDDQGSIRIRGVTSIANNNEPLVMIDGVEGDINSVNPKDIEGISVLKDASSAAIYGNRAAAGVLLITTKSGRDTDGRLTVSYNGSYSLQEPTTLPEAVGAIEYLDLKAEMYLYNGELKNYESEKSKYLSGEKAAINSYLKYFRVAPMHDHYINLSMGSKLYKGSMSFGYADQDGVLIGTDNRKYSFRANQEFRNRKRTFFGRLNLSGYRTERNQPAAGANAMIQEIHIAGPTCLYKSWDGLYGYLGRHMAQIEAGGNWATTTNVFTGKATLGAEPIEGLEITGSYAVSYSDVKNAQFVAPITTAGDLYGDKVNTVDSYMDVKRGGTLSTTVDLTVGYRRDWGEHRFSVLAGASQFLWKSDQLHARRNNMSAYVPSLNLGDPATQINDDAINERATRSLFGRIGYSYDDRYLFEVNARYDGSSRFYNRKWGFFPSVAFAWRVSEEPFFKNSDVARYISNLKLRTSWGRLGNEYMTSYYTGYPTMSTDINYDFAGSVVAGAAITELSNPDTSWETSEQINIGLDVGFLRCFTLTVDAYYKKTSDILMRLPIAPSLIGNEKGGPYQNAGAMENKGLEFTLNYRQKIARKVNVSATFIASLLRNKVLDLNGTSPIIDPTLPIAHIEGMPVGAYFGYRMDGIYQMDDFTWQNDSDPSVPIQDRQYRLKPGLPVQTEGAVRPGDLKYRDLSGPDGVPDGEIDLDYDREVIGNPFPDATLSLNLSVDWKGLDFNMFWQSSIGRDMYNQGPMVIPFYRDWGNVWADMVSERWTADNPTNSHPRLNYSTRTTTTRSSYYIYDASFLRLKNIEIGYSLPSRWLKKIHIRKLRVYAGIQNAWTWTDFPGWDPERPSSNISSEVYPQVRIYNFGINLSF